MRGSLMPRRRRRAAPAQPTYAVLREMVGLLGGELRSVLTLRGYLETMLVVRPKNSFSGTGGRPVLMAIHAALERDLVLGLSRILDETTGPDIASLFRAVPLIGTPDLMAAI